MLCKWSSCVYYMDDYCYMCLLLPLALPSFGSSLWNLSHVSFFVCSLLTDDESCMSQNVSFNVYIFWRCHLVNPSNCQISNLETSNQPWRRINVSNFWRHSYHKVYMDETWKQRGRDKFAKWSKRTEFEIKRKLENAKFIRWDYSLFIGKHLRYF